MVKNTTESLFATEETKEDKEAAGHIIRIGFESAVDTNFDYLVPDRLWPIRTGQRVEVPFGRKNKHQIGFCVETDINPKNSYCAHSRGRTLKKVTKLIDKEPLINPELMELAKWISTYYVCPLGQALSAIVPSAVKKEAGTKKQKFIYLVKDYKKLTEQLKGKNQIQIVAFLEQKNALNSKAAVESTSVLQQIGCTNVPVKRLAEKLVIKIIQKTTLAALPTIPKGMTIRTEKVILNDDQKKALSDINEKLKSGQFGVTLLYGVTDSGKTEVYIRAIESCLKLGKSAIVMLPEIALTTQTIQRFSSRFEKIAVMHSGLTPAQRNVQWQKIKTGNADVVIGARSAVFAPLSDPGLIVIDEEHEPSYKQDTSPRYNGKDVAIKRTQLLGAHCILGSATPSLETLLNCLSKKHFHLTSLPKRVMDLPAPEMKLIDLRNYYSSKNGMNLISEPLDEHLRQTLERKEQAILLLNRRGYSSFVFCPSCKHTLNCRNCDVSLTFHKSPSLSKRRPDSQIPTITGKHMSYGSAICHYCGAKTLVHRKCPLCGKGMTMIGLGAQRLEEELAKKFPHARTTRVDTDAMQGKNYYQLLKNFGQGKIDILAGTQMLAKGLHFPNVTLVGIINADTSLYLPDFRANERTFQLICQVAGRAGRSEKKGTVFIQTFLPDQPAIQFALKRDFHGFVEAELKHRKTCNLPPFWRLAAIVMRDTNFDKLQAASQAMHERITFFVKTNNLDAIVRGPMPPVISRIQRFHRTQIIIQAPDAAVILKLFNLLRAAGSIKPAVKVVIDIDPVNLL